jgi:excinuclease ABC subunit C
MDGPPRERTPVGKLFAEHERPDFGPSRVLVEGRASQLHIVESDKRAGIEESVRAECPKTPGVYGMLDRTNNWVYVGKAKRLRVRLLSYFRAKTRAAKERRILDRARAVAWEPVPSEFAALLRELELIQRFRPHLNVKGQPDGRDFVYVCLGKTPAPHAFTAAVPPRHCLAWFGPIPNTYRAVEAVRRVNDQFGLRDCPRKIELAFADRPELFPTPRTAGCLRYELRQCLGPCIAACSERQYDERVRAARRFLAGSDSEYLETLRRDLRQASANLEFERAAEIHARLAPLEWLLEQLGRLRFAKGEYSFVYPVRGVERRPVWYLIHGGLVVRALPAPTKRDGLDCARTIERTFAQPPVQTGATTIQESDLLALVTGWFRNRSQELERTLAPDEAIKQALGVQRRRAG